MHQRAGTVLLALAAFALSGPALAQTAPSTRPAAAKPAAPAPAAKTGAAERPSALGGLGSSKEPIKIDSDRLDVFDREGRAVFSGNVVAVQGDSTMQCTVMTVFYEQNRDKGGDKTKAAPKGSGVTTPGDGAIKKIDCTGPVTVVSKTQTATGDRAEFDRAANKVILTGNVALSDGPNITRGERIVYDTTTGIANVETSPGGRVKALFIPGSGEKSDDKKGDDKKAEEKKPAAAKPKAEAQKRNTASN